MKFIAIASLLIAAVNADYVFNLLKINKENIVDMTCTINNTNPASLDLEVSKYTHFLAGNDYSHYVFDCHNTTYGSKCFAKVNEIACETGYEGEFCNHYGGYDKVIKCSHH